MNDDARRGLLCADNARKNVGRDRCPIDEPNTGVTTDEAGAMATGSEPGKTHESCTRVTYFTDQLAFDAFRRTVDETAHPGTRPAIARETDIDHARSVPGGAIQLASSRFDPEVRQRRTSRRGLTRRKRYQSGKQYCYSPTRTTAPPRELLRPHENYCDPTSYEYYCIPHEQDGMVGYAKVDKT